MGNPSFVIWSPVRRTDIAWNFEKFLIGPDGVPIKRYSRKFPAGDIAEDIQVDLLPSSFSTSTKS